MIRKKPDSCISCSCFSHGSDFSQIEGTGANGILIVGEASGGHESRDQLPFRPFAPAGGVLERAFNRMGLKRNQFAITNVLRCRPRNDWFARSPWEFSAARQCRQNLIAAIATHRPHAILALGNISMRELTGFSGVAEEMQTISHLTGYVLPCAADLSPATLPPIPVIPGFHPSHLRRGKMAYFGQLCRTIRRATEVAASRDHSWIWNVDPDDSSTWGGKRYNTHPSLDDAQSFLRRVEANPNLPIAEDIETPESASMDEDAREGYSTTDIRQIQFSMGKDEGIAFPWQQPYRSIAAQILHSSNPKYGHNWDNYDHKVLRAAAAREGWIYAPTVRVYDTLDMFHHWQPDLPAHLQFACSFINFPFPWKHLHTIEHEPFYGCVDVDSDWQLGEFCTARLKAEGLWGDATVGYLGQVYEVRPVLAAMEDRGMPIDNSARLALDAEFSVAQEALGEELCKLAGDIGNVDSFVTLNPELRAWFLDRGLAPKYWHEHPLEELYAQRFTDPAGARYRYEQREVEVAATDDAGEPTTIRIVRWCRVYDFNPNSRDQVIAYMKAHGHKIPKSKEEDDEGNQKDTTNEKELRRLAVRTGDSFYLRVVEYRGFTKLRSTYIDGFVPGSDGCVHTTFTFAPAIGQLSSRNPNIQNFTKLKPTVELAKAMRRMVAARPGHILTEWDFKSCHIITLGFLAEDLNYMRLGRLDMHSFMAGHFLKHWDGARIFSESDSELLTRFKWLKSDPDRKRVRDDQAKHAILGIGNGLRAKGLYERYLESFPPTVCPACQGYRIEKGLRGSRKCRACAGSGFQSGQRTAEAILQVAEALFPKVFTYQESERKIAHSAQRLVTPFAYARRFYEVFRPGPGGSFSHGDQAEEAVAYRLANIAFGHIREKLKELYRAGLDVKYSLFNNVHDSFMFHFPESLLEEHIREVYPVLVRPSTVLRHPTICPAGLVIDVEGSWGYNWKDMNEIKVPSLKSPVIPSAAEGIHNVDGAQPHRPSQPSPVC